MRKVVFWVDYLATVLLLLLLSPSHAQTQDGDFPSLSSGTGSTATATGGVYDGLTDAPTVTNPNAVPTYPAPTIPPTAEAPFMQKSAYPPGTVFICFGAALGFLLASVLLWHAWVAWSMRRGMQRAKMGYTSLAPQGPSPHEPGLLDRGVQMLKNSNPFYTHPDSGSMIAMSLLHHDEQQARPARPQSSLGFAPDKKSLFFSPTAAPRFPAPGLSGKRESTYMPGGYYAAGGPERTISHTESQGHTFVEGAAGSNYLAGGAADATAVKGPARGQSPGLAQRLLAAQQQSTTSPDTFPASRAPSTHLEDMFNARPVSQGGLNRL